jgi:hypothetical protein
MYLLYATQEEAINRADQEGQAKHLCYWTSNPIGISRWVSRPRITAKPLIGSAKWSLDVSDYTLTEEEQAATVNSVTYPSNKV